MKLESLSHLEIVSKLEKNIRILREKKRTECNILIIQNYEGKIEAYKETLMLLKNIKEEVQL